MIPKNKEAECSSIEELNNLDKCKGKLNINYIRVLSLGQKDDYVRQEELLKKMYPNNKRYRFWYKFKQKRFSKNHRISNKWKNK